MIESSKERYEIKNDAPLLSRNLESKIRILIVDDHEVVRNGLRVTLNNEDDLEIIGEAEFGHQAIEMAGTENPDIILLDVRLPDMDGFEVAKVIRSKQPNLGIIMLTCYESKLFAAEARSLGIQGFIGKNVRRNLLINSIRVVHEGGNVFSFMDILPSDQESDDCLMSLSLQTKSSLPNNDAALTQREREILSYLVKGLFNKEIAGKLGLACDTVKKAIHQLFHKLNVSNRTQAAIAAKRLGID